MGSGAILIMSAVIIAILLGAVVAWGMRRSRALVFDKDRYPGLVALRRRTVTARYVGVAAGLAVFVVVAASGRLGRGLFLAPAITAVVLICAVLIGQRLAHDTARTTGVAGVERRLVRHYVPRHLTLAVVGFLALLLASAIWTTLTASPDGLGLGRALTVRGAQTISTEAGPQVVVIESTRSPFPGGYYTLMLAVGMPIVFVLGFGALRVIARRPRNGADPELVAVDDLLRKQTAEGVVAAAGVAVSLSLVVVSLGAALPLAGMTEYGIRYTIGAVAFGVSALASLMLAAWCSVLLLVPSGGMVKPS